MADINVREEKEASVSHANPALNVPVHTGAARGQISAGADLTSSSATLCSYGDESTESHETNYGKSTKITQKKKPKLGWPNRTPFQRLTKRNLPRDETKYIYSSELTWKEREAYRMAFLREYLSEIWKCIPYAKRLLLMIIRISPWRVAALILLNVLSGLLSAFGLTTRGRFVHMVFPPLGTEFKSSYNVVFEEANLTQRALLSYLHRSWWEPRSRRSSHIIRMSFSSPLT